MGTGSKAREGERIGESGAKRVKSGSCSSFVAKIDWREENWTDDEGAVVLIVAAGCFVTSSSSLDDLFDFFDFFLGGSSTSDFRFFTFFCGTS